MKNIIAFVLISILSLMTVSVSAASEIIITVNNNPIVIPSSLGTPYKAGDNVMFPVRAFGEMLGCSVNYDSTKKAAILKTVKGIVIEIPENKNYILVNGIQRNVPVMTVAKEGRLYANARSLVTYIQGSSDTTYTQDEYLLDIKGFENQLNPKFIKVPGITYEPNGSTDVYTADSQRSFEVIGNYIQIYNLDENSESALKNAFEALCNEIDPESNANEDFAKTMSIKAMDLWEHKAEIVNLKRTIVDEGDSIRYDYNYKDIINPNYVGGEARTYNGSGYDYQYEKNDQGLKIRIIKQN